MAHLTCADVGLLELLDERELRRVSRCAGEADRARMLLGAALLRCAVGAQLGVSPVDLTVDRTCDACGGWHGRPTVPGADVDVSVSHSGAVVVVAVLAGVGRVGVDVERIQGRSMEEVVAWTSQEARFKAGGGAGLHLYELQPPAPGHVLTLATDQRDAAVTLLSGAALLVS
ncbi:hypothetical protein E1218_01445 [Kribbella turkmenica]|uniref:4'-phosphopantetheinyl transferase n=1 Tax=Kribbella turkmenica TaxID=2530375 RepID=A0A4R4XHN3_9ACTN|nr:hypothetical protein [Kribbella turkmenica]TDD30491.1 hypothetical protein E1218_01445 [Kribbella turkmenica]